jgi:hypothetical protein
MLEDQANKWVERADEAYSQCLIEVGREKSNEVTHLVWTYGLSHFIREQVRDFLYLACGIGDTLRTVAAYSPQFPFLEDVMPSELQRVRRVDGIVERLQEKWKKKVSAEMPAQSPTLTQSGAPTVPVSQVEVTPAAANVRPRPKGSAKTPSAAEKKRRRVIFGAIQAGARGPKYCKILDGRNLTICADWIESGCPKNYADAYKAGQKWQKRIQQEKYRYKKKYDQTSAAEREKQLQ